MVVADTKRCYPSYHDSALFRAVHAGFPDEAAKHLLKGADPNLIDESRGVPPLHMAAANGGKWLSLIKVLMKNGV